MIISFLLAIVLPMRMFRINVSNIFILFDKRCCIDYYPMAHWVWIPDFCSSFSVVESMCTRIFFFVVESCLHCFLFKGTGANCGSEEAYRVFEMCKVFTSGIPRWIPQLTSAVFTLSQFRQSIFIWLWWIKYHQINPSQYVRW